MSGAVALLGTCKTSSEVLNLLASGKLSGVDMAIVQAKYDELNPKRNGNSADAVSVDKNGRIRAQNGSRIEGTAAQFVTAFEKQDEIIGEIKARKDAKVTTTKKTVNRKNGKEEYTEYRLGDLLVGYSEAQVEHVLEFVEGK
jgi:hypothetical protein